MTVWGEKDRPEPAERMITVICTTSKHKVGESTKDGGMRTFRCDCELNALSTARNVLAMAPDEAFPLPGDPRWEILKDYYLGRDRPKVPPKAGYIQPVVEETLAQAEPAAAATESAPAESAETEEPPERDGVDTAISQSL